jgi:hypothetical protein
MKPFTKETRKRMSDSAKLRCSAEWRRNQSQKLCTPIDAKNLRELYDSGMTQTEVALALGVSQKVVFNAMRRLGIKSRKAAKREQRTNKNASWKGDSAGYQAMHRRLDAMYGRPQTCAVCHTSEPGRWYEWASLSKHYSDPKDYKRMCRKCHRAYDNTQRKQVMQHA